MESCTHSANSEKKAPAHDVKNYRHISDTSVFARAFEKTVKRHVMQHLLENDVISYGENQFGFLKGRSAETAVLTAMND